MTFTKDSFMVKFWLKQIADGLPKESVPKLFNLQEVIYEILGEEVEE